MLWLVTMGSLDFHPKKRCFKCHAGWSHPNERGYQTWYYKLGKDKPLCKSCYGAMFVRPKYRAKYPERIKAHYQKSVQPRVFWYAGRPLVASFNARTGYCSRCPNNIFDGSCKITHMHHELGYFATLPWFGREEVCTKCHGKTFVRKRKKD